MESAARVSRALRRTLLAALGLFMPFHVAQADQLPSYDVIMACVAEILRVPPAPLPDIRVVPRDEMALRYGWLLTPEQRNRGIRVNAAYDGPTNDRGAVIFVEEIGPDHSVAQFVEALAHELGHRAQDSAGQDTQSTLPHSLVKSAARTCRLKLLRSGGAP